MGSRSSISNFHSPESKLLPTFHKNESRHVESFHSKRIVARISPIENSTNFIVEFTHLESISKSNIKSAEEIEHPEEISSPHNNQKETVLFTITDAMISKGSNIKLIKKENVESPKSPLVVQMPQEFAEYSFSCYKKEHGLSTPQATSQGSKLSLDLANANQGKVKLKSKIKILKHMKVGRNFNRPLLATSKSISNLKLQK